MSVPISRWGLGVRDNVPKMRLFLKKVFPNKYYQLLFGGYLVYYTIAHPNSAINPHSNMLNKGCTINSKIADSKPHK